VAPAPAAPAASDDRGTAPPSSHETGRNKTAIIALACTVAALLLIGVGVFAFTPLFHESDTTTADTTAETETDATETSDDATTTSASPGEATATDGDFTFSMAATDATVTVTSPTDASEQKTASNGQYFIVYLTVGSTASSAATFPIELQVLNAAGVAYPPDVEASAYLSGGEVTVTPGDQANVAIAFDVPVGISPTSIKVHGSPDGPGVELPL
jgi:hypothetical protein